MSEPMALWVESWPLAADPDGGDLWLVSGLGQWIPSMPVPADSEPFAEVLLDVAGHGIPRSEVRLLHQTSSRVDGPRFIATHMVEVEPGGFVLDRWRAALPIGPLLPAQVGRPFLHPGVEAPMPRHVDVLLHGLRHLLWLRDTDAEERDKMSVGLQRGLDRLRPDLYRMYGRSMNRAA